MKRYRTAEEITAAFIADGWNKNTVLRDTTPEELYDIFGYPEAYNGKRLYTMISTGNIFDDRGQIFFYNIHTTGGIEK